MHICITMLAQKASLEDAISAVNWFLENEHSFFDSFTLYPDSSCALSKMRIKHKEKLKLADPVLFAEVHLGKAEKLKREGFLSLSGHHYKRAGYLYLEELSDDMPFYNMTETSYRFPEDEEGWFAVETDFHF